MEQEMESLQKFYNIIIEFFTNYSFQLVGALIVVMIGWFFSKYVFNVLMSLFEKYDFDQTLAKFVSNVARVLVLGAMVIVALGKLGISIAPFIAAIGAISLTAGLALQGSVSNFAAGVVLIMTRPFKVGDTISISNIFGEVEEIKLAYTTLKNEDEELITVPNKQMIGEVLVNSFEYRVAECSVGISYDDDIEKAIDVIKKVLAAKEELSSENSAIVGIEKFGDSSVNIAYRYWVPTKEFFKIQYEVNLAIYKAIGNEKLTIPYPQRDVRIYQK